ncbi:DUF4332 domain-containing protein [Sedimentibacter sp. zth1]|uniref:DUF4332 domain-containing protein n=1 Tax=Sedimentibacter sp. zth1 TaxID=2816908 RepID=UPI001A93297D|nr:DUF4332 domain-containing protein [Sedimentibacter sp. zth1]QSX04996.1 DUF4332 domain-containing protein [Sedimentibacter sp. zth1]
MELDNIDIENLAIVLNKNTTLSRFSKLIENKEKIIRALIMANILTSENFFEQYANNSELLVSNTMLDKSIVDLLASFLSFYKYKTRKIKEYTSIGVDNITKLMDYGIISTKDIIYRCDTSKKRKLVAHATEVSECVIERAVCLSDISRLPGIKDIRASLYYDCGFISMKNIAIQEPKEFIDKVSKFIKANNIEKKPPLNKEISTQIAWAKVYKELIK